MGPIDGIRRYDAANRAKENGRLIAGRFADNIP